MRADGVAPDADIDAVEAHLDSRAQGQPIEAAEIARTLGFGERTTADVLAGYANLGVLYSRHHVRCPGCSTLHPSDDARQARAAGDELPCSHCDRDLADPDDPGPEVTAFYLA